MSTKVKVRFGKTGEVREVDTLCIYPGGRILVSNEGKDEFLPEGVYVIENSDRGDTADLAKFGLEPLTNHERNHRA